VLVHGWSCDASYWDNQVEALAPTYRVVRVDLAGHGSSGLERTGWTMAAFGQDVKTVADVLKLERMVLVGHSMGGPVVLEAARLMPGRVLAVIGVDTLHDANETVAPEQLAKYVSSMEADFKGEVNTFVRSMFPPGADPALVDRVAADMASAPPRVAVAAFREFLTFDLKAALRAVAAPVICVNATTYPTNVDGNRAYSPSFSAVLMEGVGHFPMLEQPAAFNRVLKDVLMRVAGPREAPVKQIVKQVEVKAPLAEVWRVWTTAAGAEEFFAPKARVELEPGGAYELFFMPDNPPGSRGAEGLKVLSYLPMEMLSFDWSFPPSIPSLRDSGARTWVVIQLSDLGNGSTRVRLTHLGWQEGPDWDQGFAYFQQAWDVVLGRLQQRFATGPVDWSR